MENADFERCISEIANGKKDPLRQIYEDFSHVVFLLAFSILGQKEAAEDVTQEVFIKIWKNAGAFRSGNNPKAWIMRITRNAAIDTLRKNSREFSTDISALRDPEDTDPTMETDEKLELQRALSRLDDRERQIIVMRTLGGLTYGTIGRIMSIPLPTVAWKYRNGLKKLKIQLSSPKEVAE